MWRSDVALHPDGRLKLRRRTVKKSPYTVWGRRVAIGLAAFALLVTVVTVVEGVRGRADLVEARTAMEEGRAGFVRSDLETALSAFERARVSFEAANAHLGNPAVRIVGAVPTVGNSVDASRALGTAGRDVALAGAELASGTLRLPEGIATLAPVDGVIPVRALEAIAPFLDRASGLVSGALVQVKDTPTDSVVAPVLEARELFIGQIGQIDRLLFSAAQLTKALPSFLGADGPRRYFFGAQSLGEGRPTGGCICAFTILEVDRGRLSFGEFVTSISLTPLAVDAPAPNPEFAERYGRFFSTGFLNSVNYSPDVPEVSEGILNIYQTVRDERLDGVILADLFVLEALVRATGPIEVPNLGLLTADQVVPVISNDGYEAFENSTERKALLGDVASTAFQQFLERGAASDPARAARVLVEAGGQGHLQLFSERPEEQQYLAATGLTGPLATSLQEGTADVEFGVFSIGVASNKSDFYVDRLVDVDLQLQSNGDARGRITVSHTNTTPTSGLPVDVIGPNVPEVVAGENLQYLSLYCGPTCRLSGASLDGGQVPVSTDSEAGRRVYTALISTLSGQTTTMVYQVVIPGAAEDGDFTFRFDDQPLVNPVRLRVDVGLPDGQVATDRGDFTQADGFLTWEQRPVPVQTLSFDYGQPADIASTVWRWLNSPLF